MKGLHIPLESTKLENGLRVVVSPDRTAPVATLGVYYNIGFRLEPRGRSGFAHLFEHMMFQGSEHAGKMVHIKLINSSGGVLNGSTHYDVTNYYESIPSNALERVLWLEADRMRALKVDDENLRNQRDVVKEEVRVNVLNQPYGGFPWLDLPPVAFRNWANAHNFYGDFADLDAATLEDVQQFFRTYYSPSNAVLLMIGDVTPEEGFALARRHFGSIPPGPPQPAADVREGPLDGLRRGEVEEKFGTLPAFAVGYRAPERKTPDWYAAAMLDHALHGGRAGRVYRQLVLEQQIAVDTGGGIQYPVGDLFDYNGPTLLVSRVLHKPEHNSEQSLAAYDAVIDAVREHGIERDELEQVKVKFRSEYVSSLEGGHGGSIPRYGLMHYLACFTLFDNDPSLVNSILDGFLQVTTEQVRAAAERYLDPQRRAIVFPPAVEERSGMMAIAATADPFAPDPLAKVPELATERPVVWPARTYRKLANGLEVVLVESHTIPKFTGELYVRSGNANVATKAPGLAEITAAVLRTGTEARSSRQIEEDLRRMGADIGTSSGADTSAIAFNGLTEFSAELLKLVAELAQQASFPEEEFERERRQTIEGLRIERTTPSFLANERFRRILLARIPTPSSRRRKRR